MMATGDEGHQASSLSSLTCVLPTFWGAQPEVWFAMAEAKFSLANITRELTKFNYVLSVLPPEVAAEVLDLITRPDKEHPYTNLKEALIARMSLSEKQKVKRLLSGLELGDRKPSQLLRQMNALVGEGDKKLVNDSVLREFFINQMPTNIQPVLVSLESLPLTEQATIADKILETTPSLAVSSVNFNSTAEPSLRELIQKMDQVLKKLDRDATSRHRSPVKTRYNSTNRNRHGDSRASSPNTERMCWYHKRFKFRATKCTPPCNFLNTKNGDGSQK